MPVCFDVVVCAIDNPSWVLCIPRRLNVEYKELLDELTSVHYIGAQGPFVNVDTYMTR